MQRLQYSGNIIRHRIAKCIFNVTSFIITHSIDTSTTTTTAFIAAVEVYSSLPFFPANGPSSCSNSSSAVASWYCWYSDTRSFMLLSASVNSISSIPSPVYQCKNALRRNIAENCSEMRLNSSWMAVVLPMNVDDILRPFGGISQTAVLTLFGIHSTK
uniref:Uncharacterized protein n=1 Tax=Anopheles coluzzii TaxID=1518534 RepID=A0A8W7Q206_ANOCL